ncbi:MAG: lysine--tRNA ligase, partial [Clostridia bacterium]|nr:lysine--tRNA ligase [Clostridia bacterium]
MANENINQTPNSTSELAVRREKLNALYESGNNPFEITKYDRTHESLDAIALFEEKEATLAEGETVNVRLAGRLVSKRIMGKA